MARAALSCNHTIGSFVRVYNLSNLTRRRARWVRTIRNLSRRGRIVKGGVRRREGLGSGLVRNPLCSAVALAAWSSYDAVMIKRKIIKS